MKYFIKSPSLKEIGMRFRFIFIPLSLSLGGCVLNLLEYASPENANQIFDNHATLPTQQKNFTGFVQVGDNIEESRINLWMQNRCREIAGEMYMVGNRWMGVAGPHSRPHYYTCIKSITPQAINPVITPASALQNNSSNIQKENTEINQLSIDSASAKCVELGFKKGTDKFGDCVLKISK